jgi:hypothetical protein
MLAARLARRGAALSGGALAAALSGGAASAQVAAPLVCATAKAAVFAAAGQLAAASPGVAFLAQGVLRTMFLTKLKFVVGVAFVVVALGAGGVAYRSADAQTVTTPRRAEGKPLSEVEALRKEVELLRLNLLVVLEKVRAQEAELRTLRAQPKATATERARVLLDLVDSDSSVNVLRARTPKRPDLVRQVEDALKVLREAKDDAARQRAVDALDRALRGLREQLRQPANSAPQQDTLPKKRES